MPLASSLDHRGFERQSLRGAKVGGTLDGASWEDPNETEVFGERSYATLEEVNPSSHSPIGPRYSISAEVGLLSRRRTVVSLAWRPAKQALNGLHRELMDLNPSAARSLEEGLEETLTVHRLRVPQLLRKTLASTNVIESAFSIVDKICANVKRWHDGDHRERWLGSALLVAQKRFHRVQGYNRFPLLRELEALVPSTAQVVKRKKAS
jgi:hypothetical protein